MKKRLVSLFLCVLMLAVFIPAAVSAEGEPVNVNIRIEYTTNTRTFNYTGEVISIVPNDFRVVVSGAPEGFDPSCVKYSGPAITGGPDKGEYAYTIQKTDFVSTDPNFTVTVTSSKYMSGKIKINPAKLDIGFIGENKTVTYNGTEQAADGYEVVIENDPTGKFSISDLSYTVTVTGGKGTNAGDYPSTIKATGVKSNNPNYTVSTTHRQNGKLTINKAVVDVDVYCVGNELTYDGIEHTISGFELRITSDPSGLFSESMINYSGSTPTVSGTNVGNYPLPVNLSNFSSTDTKNFNLNMHLGDVTLRINPAPVSIDVIGKTEEITYDGKSHTLTGYDLTVVDDAGGLFDESMLTTTGEISVTGTDVNEYPLTVSSDLVKCNNPNFNATIHFRSGKLVIKPAVVDVEVKGKTDEVT